MSLLSYFGQVLSQVVNVLIARKRQSTLERKAAINFSFSQILKKRIEKNPGQVLRARKGRNKKQIKKYNNS